MLFPWLVVLDPPSTHLRLTPRRFHGSSAALSTQPGAVFLFQGGSLTSTKTERAGSLRFLPWKYTTRAGTSELSRAKGRLEIPRPGSTRGVPQFRGCLVSGLNRLFKPLLFNIARQGWLFNRFSPTLLNQTLLLYSPCYPQKVEKL